MEAKLTAYIKFRDRIKNLILLAGISPYEGLIRPCRITALYGIFVFVAVFTKILFFCVANIKNILILTQGISIMFSFVTIIIKMGVCLIYREDFMMLENRLGQKFHKELEKKENQPVLLAKLSVYTKVMYIVAVLLCMSLSTYTIAPTLRIIKSKMYRTIFPGKYPFPVIPGSPIYWMVYLMELSISYFFLVVMNGVDNAFGLYSLQICGLLRLAAQHILNIEPSNPDYKDQLRECIETHQLVLRSKEALQRAYGVTIIWIYITNSIVMCTVMWQANELKNVMTVNRGLYFTCFVVLKLLQSFIYAYYGSLISQEYDNYENAIYMSSWPGSGNVRLMKDLLLILTQPNVFLKACGFFTVTMEMFEKIVNTTISYFFLIQTLEAKK